MDNVERLRVCLDGQKIGTMALYKRRLAAFQYTAEWLENGFSVSPFSLPLENRVFLPKYDPFEGLHGIFADSLPDGWGRLLVDRMLLRERINPQDISPMTRLSIVGSSGKGALEYLPEYPSPENTPEQDLDMLAEECGRILASKEPDNLDVLFLMGGSAGGARPKVYTEADGEDWIVKFPASYDPENIGKMEYDYCICAANCGITVPEIKLFPSERCEGYFGMKRFDRKKSQSGEDIKVMMASVSALLETSHRIPALDYDSLLALTWQLTKNYAETEQMFRRMCFNVYAHNRDDHSRNFTFLCSKDGWTLAPAYDLTWSSSIGGEHATSVHGNGRDPGMKDILAVAEKAGIPAGKARRIAEEIQERVRENLRDYLR